MALDQVRGIPTTGQRKAGLYAVEVQGASLWLVRFIWRPTRDEWVRASPKTRFVISDIRKMGTDDVLHTLNGHEVI